MNFLVDVHIHTVSSGHAYSTVKDYIEEAKKIGLSAIAITDHAPSLPGTCGSFHFHNLRVIPKFIDGVRVYSGVELNIMDYNGNVDLPDKDLKNLDVVIASLHPPCINDGGINYNTQALISAMNNPFIKIIGHPGAPAYPINVEEVVKCAKNTGTLLEINNTSLIPGNSRNDRQCIKSIIEACKAINHPIIVGSDAHFYTSLGKFDYALELLEEVKMPYELILNTNLEKFEEFLNIGN